MDSHMHCGVISIIINSIIQQQHDIGCGTTVAASQQSAELAWYLSAYANIVQLLCVTTCASVITLSLLSTLRYDTIRDAILTYAQKPT